jgi:hypothetical protein
MDALAAGGGRRRKRLSDGVLRGSRSSLTFWRDAGGEFCQPPL